MQYSFSLFNFSPEHGASQSSVTSQNSNTPRRLCVQQLERASKATQRAPAWTAIRRHLHSFQPRSVKPETQPNLILHLKDRQEKVGDFLQQEKKKSSVISLSKLENNL